MYQKAALRRSEIQSSEETRERALIPRQIRSGAGLFEVVVDGGGPIPKALEGVFTSPQKAQKAIDNYLNELKAIKLNKRPYHRSRINVAKDKARD